MISRTELCSNIENYIKSFISSFQYNPFEYLNEEDLRASLHTLLRNTIKEQDYLKLPENIWTNHYKNKDIYINPWRAEYPEEDKKKNNYLVNYGACKFDIAMISNEDNDKTAENKEINHYLMPVSIAIELKLRFNGFKVSNLLNDFGKLTKYKNVKNFLGMALLFEQEPNDQYKNHIKNYSKNETKNDSFQVISLDDFHLQDNMIYAVHIYPDSDKLLCYSQPYDPANKIRLNNKKEFT